MDRLGFWGARPLTFRLLVTRISVSADGSTWFLGSLNPRHRSCLPLFQYPLMDRLGFWGRGTAYAFGGAVLFQYPLMDRLGFWGASMAPHPRSTRYFSIR